MTKLINVPQGFSARMIKDTQNYGFDGLYTDGFSSCNIVVCIGEGKLILMHVDLLSASDIGKVSKEMRWVDGPRQVVIIYRKDFDSSIGVKDLILQEFKKTMSGETIIVKEVGIEVHSVFVSFETRHLSLIHPNIMFLDAPPEGLISHPQQQRFLAVQKIEQIIGLEARFKTRLYPRKKTSIFDGRSWVPMGNTELNINTSHAITKNDMQYFEKNDECMTLAKKLSNIIASSGVPFYSSVEGYMDTAFYLEGYLNDYDYKLLFKRNFKDVIASKHYIPSTIFDQSFNSELEKSLSSAGDVFDAVTEVINHYRLSNLDTQFKLGIIAEYDMFAEHYTNRKACADLRRHYSELKQESLAVSEAAKQDYANKNYSSAAELFFREIKLLACFTMTNDSLMASAYYNCGRSLFQGKEYKKAASFLAICLELRENYTFPKLNPLVLAKTRAALQECEDILKKEIAPKERQHKVLMGF